MEALIEICRVTINTQAVTEDHVQEFVELLEAGTRLRPVTVRKISTDAYRLVDGRHRLEARKRLGEISVRVWITR